MEYNPGIVGVVSPAPVNQLIYDVCCCCSIVDQDVAGIVTSRAAVFMHKAKGMVRDARTRNMRALLATWAWARCATPRTAGNAYSEEEGQPFYVNAPFGIVLVHNGNLTNARELRTELFQTDHRHTNTEADCVLLNVLRTNWSELRAVPLQPEDVFTAVRAVHKRIKGSYAVIADRRPRTAGFRPARHPPVGHGPQPDGTVMVGSESVALEGTPMCSSATSTRRSNFITLDGQVHASQCAERTRSSIHASLSLCTSRGPIGADGISVYQARLNLGEALAKVWVSTVPPNEIDVIIPIPESSRPSATQLAHLLGVPYREGFVKNRYVGRTFIMPGQGVRKKSVRQKLNVIGSEFKGRNVLLVDDSIVRGTTSRESCRWHATQALARSYLASCAACALPQRVWHRHAHQQRTAGPGGRTVEEIRQAIGCDALIYQEVMA